MTPLQKTVATGIPKIKGGLKIIQHRPILGSIKMATIIRETNGKWFISFSCELGDQSEIIASESTHKGELDPTNSVGIDLGVARTMQPDAGDPYQIDISKIKKIEKQIAIIQRRISKQKKFGDRWKYYQKIIAKKHSKISRIRLNFLHKASNTICKTHAIVVLEDLRVKNMSASAKGTVEDPGRNVKAKSGLNRSILRQGWGMFRDQLRYKTEREGGLLVLVDPKNTSRRCSNPDCGHTSKSNRKDQQTFECEKCGHTENADKNAAKNIKALGLQSLGFENFSLKTLEAPTIAA